MSIIVAFVLLSQAASQASPALEAKPVCQKPEVRLVAAPSPVTRIHPLSQEPPAKQVLTVVRTFDGCSKPVVIREDVGALKR